ncbi:unnamed protein product [Choristocarpus tenellus]
MEATKISPHWTYFGLMMPFEKHMMRQRRNYNVFQVEGELVLDHGQGSSNLSVRRCLEHFLLREQLNETEMWYCPNCQKHRQAYKELSLWRLPPVLLIHLKRFSYDISGGWGSRDKIESLVTFPVRGLDLGDLEAVSSGSMLAGVHQEGLPTYPDQPGSGRGYKEGKQKKTSRVVGVEARGKRGWDVKCMERKRVTSAAGGERSSARGGKVERHHDAVSKEAMYDLFGVVNHYGGLGAGHYSACALNENDGQWYNFSDATVSKVVSEGDLVTPAAYVLFYQRRG